MYLQSYLAHVWGQVGLSIPIPKLWSVWGGGGGGVAKQLPTISFQHAVLRNKVSGSSSAAPQSLQDGSPRDCPYFCILNLEVLDSSPCQPRRRRILKFDLDVRWIQSWQWVTFQSGGEKFGPHMDNCSRSHMSPPCSKGVGELEFQGS